jgi:glucokinase
MVQRRVSVTAGPLRCGRVTRCYLAVDVGGTKMAAGVVDDTGRILIRDRLLTPPKDVWASLSRLVLRVLAAAPTTPIGCGVGCGGPIDPAARTVSPLYVPSWSRFPLGAELEELVQMPVSVDTDARALALAEAWCGAAMGVRDFIGVVMGTGVGGGVVSGGRLLQGRIGNAGYIGHIVVEPDGRPCVCGGKGCLETYCGGRAIEAETGRPPQRAPAAIVERTGVRVGRALASVGAVCDLKLAIVGGSVALGFGEPFFRAAQEELDRRARLPYLQGFRIIPAMLGPRAPLIGAAALARVPPD